MNHETVQEILGKQLQLLSERSHEVSDTSQLCELTNAMVSVSTVLLGY